MEIEPGKITVIINPPKNAFKKDLIIDDKKFKDEITVLDFLSFSPKYVKALKLVLLDEQILNTKLCNLSSLERIKVRLAFYLLKDYKKLIIKNLSSKLIYSEQQYFKRLLRNLVSKQQLGIILIENNMDFLCEFVKEVIIYDGKNYKVIDDFYNMELYKYTKMPKTIELIKYLETCGHKIDHEVTFSETLKAIYRGVKWDI